MATKRTVGRPKKLSGNALRHVVSVLKSASTLSAAHKMLMEKGKLGEDVPTLATLARYARANDVAVGKRGRPRKTA